MLAGVEVESKLLEVIRAYPGPMRRELQAECGIHGAESFFGVALTNPDGIALALDTEPAEADRLIRLVEGYLPADSAGVASTRSVIPAARSSPRAGPRADAPRQLVAIHARQADVPHGWTEGPAPPPPALPPDGRGRSGSRPAPPSPPLRRDDRARRGHALVVP